MTENRMDNRRQQDLQELFAELLRAGGLTNADLDRLRGWWQGGLGMAMQRAADQLYKEREGQQ